MNQKCKVCGEPAAGFHFGAFTCEGCKSFFGRTYNNTSSIPECKNGGNCSIDKKNRTVCKSCRLRKCLLVGMSKSGSRYGRRSNWFKVHCLIQEKMDVEFGSSSFGLYGSLERDPLSPFRKSPCEEKIPPGGSSPGSYTSEGYNDETVGQAVYPNMINLGTTNPSSLSTIGYGRKTSFSSMYDTDDTYDDDGIQESPIDLSCKEPCPDSVESVEADSELVAVKYELGYGGAPLSCPLDLTKKRTPVVVNNGDRHY